MTEVIHWVGYALSIFGLVLFIRVIMSWVLQLTQYRPTGAAAVFFELVYTVTDPPLRLIRRFVPDVQIGAYSIPMSFVVLGLGVYIVSIQLMGW